MSRRNLRCYHCDSILDFEYAHAGFGNEIFFYCNRCGMVATIDIYTTTCHDFYEKHRLVNPFNPYEKGELERFERNFKKMKLDIAAHLAACSCGGTFTVDAIPRCPVCEKELEWDKVVDQLDKHSGRVTEPSFRKSLKKGWRDIYYFIFNDRIARNNWKIGDGS